MNIPSMALVHQLEEVLREARPFNSDNTGRLEELREQMVHSGFNAPFKGIIQKTMEEARDLDEAEWADLRKQVSYFRQIASLKKYSLARAGIALSAHRLSEHFLEMGYSDIVGHCPLDGNHISLLMEAGGEGIVAYREIMDRFDRMADTSNCFQVKVVSGGEKYSIQVDSRERIDYKVARMFGLEAQVTEVKPSVRKKPIISSKGTRISLVSSVVSYVSGAVEGEMREAESGKMKEYNDFLREKKLRPDVRIDQVEGYGEIKEGLGKKGLLGRKGGEYSMDKGLAQEIGKRKRERAEKLLKRSTMLVLLPMFKFYLSTPRETRKKQNLYPGMAVTPSDAQTRIFTFLYEEDRDFPAPSILRKKLEIEESGARFEGKRLAAALLMRECKKDEAWIAQFLKMKPGEVRSSAVLLGSLQKEGKGSEFLKRIKRDT